MHQVIDRRIAPRATERLAPQVDEHVVGIQVAVLLVQVVGVEPDHLRADRDGPRPGGLGPCPVVVDPRGDRQLALGGSQVLMAKPQRFPDPNARVPQKGPEQAVPKMGARVQDRLHLGGGQDHRLPARAAQLDRAPPLRLARAQVVEERLPARPPPGGLQLGDQVTEVDPVPCMERVEPADRRQLPVDRDGRAVMLCRGQHGHPARAARRRQPQPGDELAEILQPDLAPVQAPHIKEAEPVLQVVGVGLDGVRRPLDIGQVSQVALDRLYRAALVAEDRPGLKRRDGHHHPLNKHRTSGVSA